jgi:hypothetical protein
LEEKEMNVITNEATDKNGQIRMPPEADLPEDAKVYVVVPDPGVRVVPRIHSPRLAHPEQAADFVKEVIEERTDAGV